MSSRTPGEIKDLVDQHEKRSQALRDRMEADHKLYRLDRTTGDAEAGYAFYTSNAPMTFADKIITWIVGAEMTVTIPQETEPRLQREVESDKERVVIGMFKAADERLLELLQPPLRDQEAAYAVLRGFAAGRVLLAKDDDERTYVNIDPWDALHTFWGMGAKGLAWACYRTYKTPEEIKAEYGKVVGNTNGNEPTDTVAIYDMYDEEDNQVVTEDMVLKAATPHGARRVPAVIVPVGSTPPLYSLTNGDTSAEFGESVFKATRGINEDWNTMMSVVLELVSRARKQGVKVFSADGTKTLPEDPFKSGAEIALAKGREDVEPLGMLEAAKETAAFLGMVSGEMQRGSLPFSAYGELQFQLSGFAINTLRQGIETILQPRLLAVQNFYKQAARMLCDQYATGQFDAMRVSGWDRNRKYFDMQITPEVVAAGGDPEIRLVGILPQDETSKMAMAQIAREGPVPLLPDRYIRDSILGIQDTDVISDTVNEQLAERVLPEAMMYTLMKATENRGRPDLAMFYYSQLMQMVIQKMMMGGIMPQVAPPGGGGGPGQNGGPPGFNPAVLPQAMQGVPPVAPGPSQVGPFVPPGTLRPGASPAGGLSRLGLFGPGG